VSDKIVQLADYSQNARHWGIDEMLRFLGDRAREEGTSRGFALHATHDDGTWTYGWAQAGLTDSDLLVLLTLMQAAVLERMRDGG